VFDRLKMKAEQNGHSVAVVDNDITNACADGCMKAVPKTSRQSLSVSERNEGLSEIEIVDNVEPSSDDDVPVHKKQRKMPLCKKEKKDG